MNCISAVDCYFRGLDGGVKKKNGDWLLKSGGLVPLKIKIG
jgi:hypothetical protein